MTFLLARVAPRRLASVALAFALCLCALGTSAALADTPAPRLGFYKGKLTIERTFTVLGAEPKTSQDKTTFKIKAIAWVPAAATRPFVRVFFPPRAILEDDEERGLTIDFGVEPPAVNLTRRAGDLSLAGFAFVTVEDKAITVTMSVGFNNGDITTVDQTTLSLKFSKP